jgi:DNA-binding response OmpR family regulator
METKPKILLVDDEETCRKPLKAMLELNGFDVIEAETGKEALAKLREKPDAILLDLILPDMYGLEVMLILGAKTDIPVIILTVKDDIDDIRKALTFGAVDFITKPNKNDDHLIVKLNHFIGKRSLTGRNRLIVIGDIILDRLNKIVQIKYKRLDFTMTEYKIFELFATKPNELISNEEIIRKIWGEEQDCDDNYVRYYIMKIREKIEKDASNPKILITERGRGYMLVKRK